MSIKTARPGYTAMEMIHLDDNTMLANIPDEWSFQRKKHSYPGCLLYTIGAYLVIDVGYNYTEDVLIGSHYGVLVEVTTMLYCSFPKYLLCF
jgi:hypothetical protein